MTDFIQRLQKLEETRKGFIAEKNKLEATIAVQEEAISEIRNQLSSKGITYENIQELEEDIQERERYLEQKISNLEEMAQTDVVEEASIVNTPALNTSTVNTPLPESTSAFDFEISL